MRDEKIVFVFGSNYAGRHGAGAALYARNHYGARYGVGKGRQGNAYAIPTKDGYLRSLPLNVIEHHVLEFIQYAIANPGIEFLVTRVGCGLAGYKDNDIAPMFKKVPDNCMLPVEWKPYVT